MTADRTKRTVARVAAVGLVEPAAPPIRVPELAWPGFLIDCEDHRLLGLLSEAVRTGEFELDGYQRDSLELSLRRWLSHDLRVERMAQRIGSVLAEHQIDYRLLKGVVMANLLYPEPSMRIFSDVDVLVESGSFSVAAKAISEGLGATRALPELRPGFDDRFGREILLRSGDIEVDLHRTLVDGPFGLRIPLKELFERPEAVTVGDQKLLTVNGEAQFLHACISAVLGAWPPRLMVLRDVLELLREERSAVVVDPAAVLAAATRWKAKAVVALALQRAQTELGVTTQHPLGVWARGFRPSAADRVLLRTYRGRARGYTSQLASVVAIDGWADRSSYLRAILRPDSPYLAARGFRRGERLRRAVGLARR